MCYMPRIHSNYFRIKNYAEEILYFLRVADFPYKPDATALLGDFML
jgi:hypothetical protein